MWSLQVHCPHRGQQLVVEVLLLPLLQVVCAPGALDM
jgi:hypothetical protein